MNSMATVNPFEEIVPVSVSGSAPSTNYFDVFINHRGTDVKLTLATDIRDKLSAAGVPVFLDVDSLQPGDAFPAKIEQAMRSASVHLAIFSIHYAESPWCLSELSFMLQTGKTVIPVFYNVQPSDLRWVRQDKGVYAADFSHYKAKGYYSTEKLEEWMVALEKASFLNGIEFRNDRDEGMLLKNIVNVVSKILPKAPFIVARKPVGLDDIVLDFERKTAAPAQNVQIVGIVGMGGAGKTTLAKELYNRKSSSYQRSSFVFEVRDAASRKTLHKKQKKLLVDLGLQGPTFDNLEEGKATLATRLRSVQALIVLDDVDHENQLDALLPGQDCLALGSLVIVTTREMNLLSKWGSHIYMIKGLKPFHARELFCWHAFLQPHPKEGFENIAQQFLKACNGLPLSLEVFGGLVYKKCKDYWKSQLEKISRILPEDIKGRLKVSYDSLDEEQQEMFMDVACFFIGQNSSLATEVWNGSKWSGLQGWETLVNKCLIVLDGNSNITMHDHLRDLGRDLAERHPTTSRLWLPEKMMNIQKLIAVGKSIRGIGATQFGYPKEPFIGGRRLKKLFESTGTSNRCFGRSPPSPHGLRFLTDSGDRFIKYFSTSLEEPVLLKLNKFKGRKLPSWSLKDLRILELTYARRLRQLWDDSDPPLELRNLRIVRATELQRIPKSIGRLKELKRIVLRHCEALKNLPEEFSDLRSLEWLDLWGCSLLSSLPSRFGDLISLRHIDLIWCTRLQGLPDSFKQLRHLQHLNVACCKKLTFRSDMLESISNLEYFNLNQCGKVELLPDQITNQVFLRELYLRWTGIRELPSDIGELRKLEVLEIGSPLLASLPNSLGNLSSLTRLFINAPSLTSLPSSFDNLSRLAEPSLSNSKLNSLADIVVGSLPMITKTAVSTIPIIRDSCPSVETLRLWHSDHLMEIQSLPTSVRTLEVDGSKMLKKIRGLRGLTNLQSLKIRYCPELRELASFADLHSLQTVYIEDCDKVVKIEGLENCRSLETLEVESCWTSQVIQSLEGMDKLKRLLMVVENGSALRPCIHNINIEASPEEMWICGRAVSGAESVMDSLSLSRFFPTLTVLSSLEKESRHYWRIKLGKINASQEVLLCCFLVDSPQDTNITVEVGSFHSQHMRLREGKRVIVSVLRSGSWDSTKSEYERTVRIMCVQVGVKRGVVVVGEKGRVLEAFPHLLPVFI